MSLISRLQVVLFVCLAGMLLTACQGSSAPAPLQPGPATATVPELSQVTLPLPTDTPATLPATHQSTQTATRPPTRTPEQQTTPAAPVTTAPSATATQLAAVSPGCREQATFVRHLNLSPRTILLAGQIMAKVWRVQNSGECTWTPEYSLVFASGEPMSTGEPVPFPSNVLPGATVDLRFTLVVPEKPGEHIGYWLIQAPDGETFGIGPQASDPLAVQIVVRDPNAPGSYQFCG